MFQISLDGHFTVQASAAFGSLLLEFCRHNRGLLAARTTTNPACASSRMRTIQNIEPSEVLAD
jgi:hypothetical protein